ncbi:hypothetical protein RIR_e13975_A0A2I1H5P4_9GLOM [Rhizophagus irregularis DAOM 181602=DAOM 197198]|uniref:Uncharacterized protein n=2 Tax=Rhizophagus irregularis TaxID=588596 RepID=A0A2I1H5P4_9GLOM|nr:hypothetical protein RhiirA4_409662 [Rhizophagus irregularis]GBC14905.1 hypothetical protein RIR_e13975_A0A2I1H5P4_9GLOM [Rhizophagus irregularis DAOM 181602=DAOM 197198]
MKEGHMKEILCGNYVIMRYRIIIIIIIITVQENYYQRSKFDDCLHKQNFGTANK